MISTERCPHWEVYFSRLAADGRAQFLECNGKPFWIPVERLAWARALWFGEHVEDVTNEEVMKKSVQGWMQILGPVTANRISELLSVNPSFVYNALLNMEAQGLMMRGSFEHPAATADFDIEWCERRILQRIHKLTIGARRKQVEPVPPAVFMRWLLGWQHLAPQTQFAGEEGVLEALSQLEGFEAPAIEWERTLLPARVADYDPRWLDGLCLSGAVGWGRVSPHPAFIAIEGAGPRRVIPSNAAPITFFLRDSAAWLELALDDQCAKNLASKPHSPRMP